MPTEREWRRIERDRADQQILRRAAAWLRQDPGRAGYAGLSQDEDAFALAELLDVLATALPDVDSGVRRQAVESCRRLLGEPMASPEIRRTRRRR
jgi:HEAT repeat protein